MECRLVLHYPYTFTRKASNYGIFCFNYINVAENGELDLGLAINSKLTNEPHSVFGCLITGEWICIDTPEKYLIAQNKYDNYLREVK